MNVIANERSQQAFGKKLRQVREQRKLSQEEVAQMASISVTYYAGIERGEENPTFAVIEQVCKVLKVKSSLVLPF